MRVLFSGAVEIPAAAQGHDARAAIRVRPDLFAQVADMHVQAAVVQGQLAAQGELRVPDHAVMASEARDLIVICDDGAPRVAEPPHAGETVLVSLPDDVVSLRRADPDLGLQWRLAVRSALTSAFDVGLRVSAVTSAGAYVLTPDEGQRDDSTEEESS